MVKVETIGAGFNHYIWDVESLDEAEQFARWLSIKDADNPTYPNPYFVVTDGHPIAGFYQGKRIALPPRYLPGSRSTFAPFGLGSAPTPLLR